MLKLKVQIDGGQIVEVQSDVRVFVEGLGDGGQEQLQTVFNGDGIVHDLVGADGEVKHTDWAEYSDVEDCIRKNDFC